MSNNRKFAFLKKGEGVNKAKVNYPPLTKKQYLPFESDFPPDSGRGTAEDGRNSSLSTIARLAKAAAEVVNTNGLGGEYGVQTPSSGTSVHFEDSSLSANSSRPTVSPPQQSDSEVPQNTLSGRGRREDFRQINGTAAQLRDMIANLDLAGLLAAKKIEAYEQYVKSKLESQRAELEEEMRERMAEVARQERMLEHRKKGMTTENHVEATFLRKEMDNLTKTLLEKSRKNSELMTLQREQKKDMEQMLAEKDHFKSRCGELTKQNSGLGSENARLRTQLAAAVKTNAELGSRLNSITKKASVEKVDRSAEGKLKKQIAALENEIRVLKLPPMKNEINDLKQSASKWNVGHEDRLLSNEHEATTSSIERPPPALPPKEAETPVLYENVLPCGCRTLTDKKGIACKWTHVDGKLSVSWSDGGNHVELNSPQQVKVTFATDSRMYVVVPDGPDFYQTLVVFSNNTFRLGKCDQEGKLRSHDIKEFECVKYKNDDSQSWTIKDVAIRRFVNTETKIKIGGANMNLVHSRGKWLQLTHLNGSERKTCYAVTQFDDL